MVISNNGNNIIHMNDLLPIDWTSNTVNSEGNQRLYGYEHTLGTVDNTAKRDEVLDDSIGIM
jgi:hypothetical protein